MYIVQIENARKSKPCRANKKNSNRMRMTLYYIRHMHIVELPFTNYRLYNLL